MSKVKMWAVVEVALGKAPCLKKLYRTRKLAQSEMKYFNNVVHFCQGWGDKVKLRIRRVEVKII